jgi:hypothetical protein
VGACTALQVFFLAGIVFVGVFGAFSALQIILYLQALPAFLALVLVEIGRKGTNDLGVIAVTLALAAGGYLAGDMVKRHVQALKKKED